MGKKQKKRNWSRTASIKERKNKQNKSLKKVMVKLKKRLAAGERYVRYKDKFYRVDLAKLAEANSLLENAKKNRKALTLKKSLTLKKKTFNFKKIPLNLKRKTTNRKNALDFLLNSIFAKAKAKKNHKWKHYSIPKIILSRLKETKKIIFTHYIKRKGKGKAKKRFRRKIGVFYRRTNTSVQRNGYFFRNERLLAFRPKISKKAHLNEKIARVF